MGEVSIDKLSLEISGNADKAVKSVDKLTACLEKLKKSIENCKGLNTVSQQIEKLSAAANRMQGGKIKELSEYIDKLSLAKPPSFAKLIGQIEKLSAATSGIGGVESFAQKISDIVDAVKPLETIEKANLGSVVSFLKKIPEFTKSIDAAVLKDFKNYIEQITESLKPLTAEVRKSEKGLESLNGIMQSVVAENGNLASDNAVSVKSYTTLSSVLKDVKVKILACSYAAYNLAGSMYSWFKESNDYIENLNLFTVAMGNASEEALNYAEKVSDALGIDMSEWIRNQGVFKQVTSGFGVASEASNLMSKNLTQLGYDISSFFNIDIDESMQKLQSGISGEIEPLRRLGYALDTATLQQVAYNLGITQNINSMTQAQKSQLRYIAIMQQSTNAMGDMARTVATPANSIRILEQQFTQLKRALGNIVSVVAVKLIPYIQVAIRLLTDLAEGLAKKWGFEMPAIDYSGMGDGLSTVTDEADSAAESVQETVKEMQRLAGFDEINVLSSGDTGGSETGGTVSSNDLGLALPEYDFLKGLDKQTDELYKRAKKKLDDIIKKFRSVKKWIGLLATAFAALWVTKKVDNFVKALKNLEVIKKAKKWFGSFMDGFKKSDATDFFGKLKDGVKAWRDQLTPTEKLLGTVVGAAVASYGSYNLFHDLADGTLTWKSALADSAEIVGGLAMSWLFGGGKGLAIGIVATAFSGLYGWIKRCDDECEEALERLLAAEWQSAGENISDVAASFDEYATSITNSETTYLNSVKSLEEIAEDAGTASDNLGLLIDDLNTSELDPEKLNLVKESFDKLAESAQKYISESSGALKTYISMNSELLAEQGISASEVLKYIDESQGNLIDNLEKCQERVEELLDKGTLTESEKAELQNLRERMLEIAGIEYELPTKGLDDMKNKLENLGKTEINLENIDTAYESMDKMIDKYDETYKSITQARDEALKQVSTMPFDTEEERKGVIEAINSIYDVHIGDLHSIDTTMTIIAEKIDEANNSMKEDIENGTMPSVGSFLLDYWLGIGTDEDERIDKKLSEYRTKYGAKFNDYLGYFKSRMTENSISADDYDKFFNSSGMKESLVEQILSARPTAENSVSALTATMKTSFMSGVKESFGSQFVNRMFYNNAGEYAFQVAAGFDGRSLGDRMNKSVTSGFVEAMNGNKNDVFDFTREFLSSELSGVKETAREKGLQTGYASVTGMAMGITSGDILATAAVGGVMESVRLAAGGTDLSTQGYNVMNTYSNGFNGGKGLITETLSGLSSEVSSILDIDLTENGRSIGDTLADGIYASVNGAGGVVDLYNKLLGKSEEFSVQIMNAYNDAVPELRGILAGIGGVVGASVGQLEFINYTAKGRQVESVERFATGGFPDEGQLFIANENGPELVGQIGSRTAVANQGQITDAIYMAVLDAMRMSGKNTSQGQGDVHVYIDSDEVSARVEQRQYARSKRLGG